MVAALVGLAVVRLVRGIDGGREADEDRIRALFVEAARAAEERRVGDVATTVSERFQARGLDRRELKRLVAGPSSLAEALAWPPTP